MRLFPKWPEGGASGTECHSVENGMAHVSKRGNVRSVRLFFKPDAPVPQMPEGGASGTGLGQGAVSSWFAPGSAPVELSSLARNHSLSFQRAGSKIYSIVECNIHHYTMD